MYIYNHDLLDIIVNYYENDEDFDIHSENDYTYIIGDLSETTSAFIQMLTNGEWDYNSREKRTMQTRYNYLKEKFDSCTMNLEDFIEYTNLKDALGH